MKIPVIFLLCSSVINASPVKKTNDDILATTDKEILENTLEGEGESRAGLIDDLNPFNKNKSPEESNKNNNDNEPNNGNPLEAIQNLFSNVPQFLNGSNPFEELFSSQAGGNFLDNMKIFLVGTQGVVMPASSMLGGFQNLMQAFGNMQNLIQPPSLPSGR